MNPRRFAARAGITRKLAGRVRDWLDAQTFDPLEMRGLLRGFESQRTFPTLEPTVRVGAARLTHDDLMLSLGSAKRHHYALDYKAECDRQRRERIRSIPESNGVPGTRPSVVFGGPAQVIADSVAGTRVIDANGNAIGGAT